MLRSAVIAAFALLLPLTVHTQETTPDFSTPRATMRTFLAAIATRNADILAQCFSVESEEEFEDVRAKRLSESDWRDFQALFQGATIQDVFVQPDEPHRAVVVVKLRGEDRDQERISLRREGRAWRVLGF